MSTKLEPRVAFEGRVARDVPCAVIFLVMLLVNVGSTCCVWCDQSALYALNITPLLMQTGSIFMLASKNVYVETIDESSNSSDVMKYVSFSESLQADIDECNDAHPAEGRRLSTPGQEAEIWFILEQYPQIPVVMIVSEFCFCASSPRVLLPAARF